MKSDHQHLEFLISQYVDGCLEPANKKSVEQQLLTDPSSRKLYAEHRETQDLLDDWGNRIPLIHWDHFDQKLAVRLENETVGDLRVRAIKRWIKPAAVAASLLVAASLGYAWHGMSGRQMQNAGPVVSPVASAPHTSVQILDGQPVVRANRDRITVDEPAAAGLAGQPADAQVAVGAPSDAEAVETVRETVSLGTRDIKNDVAISPGPGVVGSSPTPPSNASEPSPFYP